MTKGLPKMTLRTFDDQKWFEELKCLKTKI